MSSPVQWPPPIRLQDFIKLARRILTELRSPLPATVAATQQVPGLLFYGRSARLYGGVLTLAESDAPLGIGPLTRSILEDVFAALYVFAAGRPAIEALARSDYVYRKNLGEQVQWAPLTGASQVEPGSNEGLGPSGLAERAAQALEAIDDSAAATNVRSLYEHGFTSLSMSGSHASASNLFRHSVTEGGVVRFGSAEIDSGELLLQLLIASAAVLTVALWAFRLLDADTAEVEALLREVNALLP
jgi:hypothetical protein